jgi:hypothetical protein
MASKFQIPLAFKSDPRGIQEAESALSGFGKKLLGIGVAVAGAFAVGAIFRFAKESVLAAERAQQFNDILVQVAKTTDTFGANLTGGTNRLLKFADAQELVIGVEAELIKETQAVLLSFKAVGASAGEVGGNFDRATIAAFDMAAVLKTDARSAAVQLGKALENPVKGVTALAKAGTTFTDQQREQIRVLVESGRKLEAQNLILDEVESQYGGAAEAGALYSARLQLAFGQIQDALGASLTPAFQRFATFFIEQVVPPLTVFFEEKFPELLANFTTTFAALQPALEQVGAVIREAFDIGEENSLLEGFLANIEKLGKNQTFLNFLEQIVVGFAEMLPDLIMLVPLMLQLAQEGVPLLVQLLPPLVTLVNALATVFGATATAIKEATADTGDWVENTKNVAKLILESLPVVGSYVRIFNDVADSIRRAGDALRAFLGMGGKAPSLPDARFRPRAVGGPVSAMDSYIVGERGPEIFTPGAAGFITPNNRLGGGSSTNITINVTAGMGANGNQIGEEIIRQIKRYERASGPVFASA